MTAILRVVVCALLAGSLVFVAAPAAAQTTRTLTVTPDTGLVDGDIVLLEGSGFTPFDVVYFCQAVVDTTPNPANCGGPIASSPANEAGELSASYRVQRFITPSSVGATVDCAQPSSNCVIGASDFFSPSPGFVVAPLTFIPQPAPTLTVTPGTGLTDGDVVVVEGTGFLPEQSVGLCQELDDQVSELCPTELDFVPADDTGAFSATYTVRRFVTAFGAGVTTDCAAPSATCALSALGSGPIGISVVATMGFAPQPAVEVAAFGTVRGPTGEPLAGAKVWAYVPSDTWVGSLQTVTDAQGSYEFEEFELGVPYRIVFFRPTGSTLVSEWFNTAPTRQLATAITLSEGQFVQANAQLSDGSAIAGSVTDTQGNPVAGVAVWAFGTGDTWVGSYTGVTGSDGNYRLENVRSDNFRVRFVPPTGSGLAIEWWDDAPNGRSADDFTVPVQTTVNDIDAVLEPSP
jgi:Carboxypeptidase regulatory-like domain/Neocarzinostatin family